MIYGMTNRMPWNTNNDPRPIWKVWDSVGMQGASMLGYWSDSCPVKTSNNNVLATVYKKNKSALVSIASWDSTDTHCTLQIDWKKLGIDAAKATIIAPEITNFQPAAEFKATDAIPVEKNKGWLLLIN